MDECGRMLVKVGKRGRKHGLGVVGISQRPADVKKDFITQCDWLLWHRLTWSNDTKVAGRILGSDYREEVEELADGECFMMSDFGESLRRVQMERKRTFDAGATPGLDDFERPELKSVSADLVGELESITEQEQQRKSLVQELERELKDREEHIKELEAELEEARDLSEMAEQFSRAMMAHATGRAFRDDITGRQSELTEHEDRPSGGTIVTQTEENRHEWERETGDTATDDFDDADDGSDNDPLRADNFGASRMAAQTSKSTTETEDGDATTDSKAEDESTGVESGGVHEARGDVEPAFDTPETTGDANRPVVAELRAAIASLDDVTRDMLAHYREHGPVSPLDAHVAAGGDGERTEAYRRNGQLREHGLIKHAGRGEYQSRLRASIRETHDDRLAAANLEAALSRVIELLPSARSLDPVEGSDAHELKS
jgi:hypothetical protein